MADDERRETEDSNAEVFQAMQPQLPEPEPAPAETGRGIGTATLRKEDAEFITGQGRYIDDVALPGMHFIAFVRSPHAHAEIRGVDPAPALELPGVVAVFTHEDLAFAGGVPTAS